MNNYFKWFHCSLYRMNKFFHVLSRDKVTSSANLEVSETQHPSESIKFVNQTKQMNVEYRFHVNTYLIATKFLLRYDMSFRMSDVSLNSLFKGSFLELMDTSKEINPEIASAIDYALRNNFMIVPKIQKNLVAACACEITQ